MRNYPSENLPTHGTILANVKKFQKTDSVHNLPRVVTKDNKREWLEKNQLTELIEEFSKLSTKLTKLLLLPPEALTMIIVTEAAYK